ncbi:hypothetical protein BKA63DRAFT_583201 [Paraphoma chrysanthemicola]|nr:hypothetical protein BKA63DRAFT_583201 [Paraphoma chrysanthemicola]
MSTATKRTHDEYLQPGPSPPLGPSDMLHPSIDDLVGSKEPHHKKKKVTSTATQYSVAKAKTPPELPDSEQDVAMTESEDEPPVQQQPVPPAPPAPPASNSSVRADDLSNNPYAPPTSNAAALAAYIKEVGDRNLNLLRTPTQATGSSIDSKVRHLIDERLFKSFSNAKCMESYNKRGGKAGSDQAVSIRFLKMVPKWFEEENVVLPWNARRKADQDRLKTLGLLPHNFSLVYPGHQPAAAAQAVHAPARKAKPAGPKRAPKKVVVQQAAANDPAEDSDAGVELNELAGRKRQKKTIAQQQATAKAPVGENDSSEEEEEQLESSYQDERRRQQATIQARYKAQSQQDADDAVSETSEMSALSDDEDDEEAEITLPGQMSDRIRAAHNHFGNDLMSLRFHEDLCTVNQSAFIKSCHTFADLDPETKHITYTPNPKDEKHFSPEIVRAFLNAISPSPGKRLPRHDYIFHTRKAKHTKSVDVLGVMNTAAVSVNAIDWTVPKLIQLRALSVIFDCPVLQDMTVAELHQLYAKHCQFGTPFCLATLYKFLNELDPTKPFDRPLTRWCIDVFIDYNSSEPYGFTRTVQVLFDSRRDTGKHKVFYSLELQDLCQAYHLHGKRSACQMERGFDAYNQSLVADLYEVMRKEVQKKDEGQIKEDLLWSLAKEEVAAMGVLRLEQWEYEMGLNEEDYGVVKEEDEVEMERQVGLVRGVWDEFREKWM